MSLLTLQDIGKIYVSEGSVAVGIRGVSLSFERGEFVAVTGKSGSGKSTLLNVISGMDSYEEGELLIEGAPTSHYLQSDWESYRERYISFIFQDYNIIESFTVLQNVELALMHIPDRRARRARALELIGRVGLTAHARQKGSRLSGGQKQRTVIARALAKDSPIILADEPTGNLDAETSREIVALLREVSRDKLLIAVTHDLSEVEAHATRHIRIYDGAVESDRVLTPPVPVSEVCEGSAPPRTRRRTLALGFSLGRAIFLAKPRLSAFLAFILLIGTLGVFAVTSLTAGSITLFDKHYMFTPSEGRLILATRSGRVIPQAELKALAAEHGATDILACDYLLDARLGFSEAAIYAVGTDTLLSSVGFRRGTEGVGRILGRAPEAEDEALLMLPISYRPIFGRDRLLVDTLMIGSLRLRLSGVSYYYDNNIEPSLCLTPSGFETVTAVLYLNRQRIHAGFELIRDGGAHIFGYSELVPAFDLTGREIYLDDPEFRAVLAAGELRSATLDVSYSSYDYYNGGADSGLYSHAVTAADIAETAPALLTDTRFIYEGTSLYVSTELIRELAGEVAARAYRQASLFFPSDRAAERAAAKLNGAGYVAVPSSATYSPDPLELIAETVLGILMLLLWLVAILFLSFFVSLCTGRTVGAFRSDMAIMRSMGIPASVIRVGIYARMLISLLPALLLTGAFAAAVFLHPQTNAIFVFLYPQHYAAITLGMLLLTLLVTRRQIRRLFGKSVKRALRGGEAE